MAIMRGLLRRDRSVPVVASSPEPIAHAAQQTPPLILLMPDAQGIAAHQLREFPAAGPALDFIEATFRGRVAYGTAAFWALTIRPDTDDRIEPLVLVRDTERAVVYVFSFSDLDGCWTFIRQELSRGLSLEQVMVYWAVPASISLDSFGRASIDPALPPRPDRQSPHPPSRESHASHERASVLTFPTATAPSTDVHQRFLQDTDVAAVISEMEDFKARFNARRPAVIDFPAARLQLRRSNNEIAWNNFSRALDEALDVHVAQRVRIQLAINRAVRALAQAAAVHGSEVASEGRWQTSDEPFSGFGSPPGRF